MKQILVFNLFYFCYYFFFFFCRRETGNGCRDEFTYDELVGRLVSIETICDDGAQSTIESTVCFFSHLNFFCRVGGGLLFWKY